MINIRKMFPASAVVLLMVGAATISGRAQTTADATPQISANVHVFATGLQAPRGLKFGPDGMLYVAEAGTGGSTSTKGLCTQVIAPVGPYTGGKTGRISRINMSGTRTTVASGLPSSKDAMGDLQGVADLAFINGTLYALLGGAGCSHGVADVPNALLSVNTQNGSWKIVANLSKFIQTNLVKYPNADDFEPDGTFYSMIPYNNRLYAVEPNHGQILSLGTDGSIGNVMDVSASQGHIVPTAITAKNGQLYLGNLSTFPAEGFLSRILSLSYAECNRSAAPGLDDEGAANHLHVLGSKAGFNMIVSIAFGPDGLLYVLSLSDAPGYPTPGKGSIVRVKPDGSIEAVAAGLVVPTAMTFGPDGKIYVSNFGAAPSGGQIVQIDVP
jgi:hypothetical protein